MEGLLLVLDETLFPSDYETDAVPTVLRRQVAISFLNISSQSRNHTDVAFLKVTAGTEEARNRCLPEHLNHSQPGSSQNVRPACAHADLPRKSGLLSLHAPSTNGTGAV